MTETIVRAATTAMPPGRRRRSGHLRETRTERDHADQYIVETMLPLLELADAFPKMIEVGEA